MLVKLLWLTVQLVVSDARFVENNIAVIDYTKCKNCGICANKCPKKVITGAKPVAPKAEAAAPAVEKTEEAPKSE